VVVRAIELDGEIKKLTKLGPAPDGCSTWRFELDKREVFTTTDTEYQRGPCKNMKNGREIEVRGWLLSDGTVRADRIRFDDDDN
jgi:hypothetical protein